MLHLPWRRPMGERFGGAGSSAASLAMAGSVSVALPAVRWGGRAVRERGASLWQETAGANEEEVLGPHLHQSQGGQPDVKISTGEFTACKFIIRLLQPAQGTLFVSNRSSANFPGALMELAEQRRSGAVFSLLSLLREQGSRGT